MAKVFKYNELVGQITYNILTNMETEFSKGILTPPESDKSKGPVEDQLQEICKNIDKINNTFLEIIHNSKEFVSKTDENFNKHNNIKF